MPRQARITEKKRGEYSPYLNKRGERVPGYFIYEPNGTICVRLSIKKYGGKGSLFIHTKKKKFKDAQAVAELKEQRYKNKQLGVDDTQALGREKIHPFREEAEWVLKHYTPDQRTTTQEKHRIYIPELIEEFGEMDVNAIDQEAFKDFLRRRKKKANKHGRLRSTFMDYQKHLNLVLRHAYLRKKASHLIKLDNPDKKTSRSIDDNEPDSSWKVYTKAEITRLWNAANDELKDQFVLSYECFMRLREVLYLTWDRVDLTTGKVMLRPGDVKTGTKTGKGREFIVSAHALERLRARRSRMPLGQPYVFPSRNHKGHPTHNNKKIWKKTKELAKIQGKATWHSLRHTALTEALLEKRRDPVAVSEYAGVSLQTIQRVYLHSKAHHTKDISTAVSIVSLRGGEAVERP